MFRAIQGIYGAGWRAGMAKPVTRRPGGTRGIKHLVSPLNPYDNPFKARRQWLRGLIWDTGFIDGAMERENAKYI